TPSPQFSSGLPLDCVLNTREAARCRAPFLLTRVGRVSGKRIRPGRATAPPHHRAQVGHRGIPMSIARRRLLPVLAALAVLFLSRASARAFDVVLSAQGEFMDAYLVNGTAFPPKYVFIDPDPADPSSITGTPP